MTKAAKLRAVRAILADMPGGLSPKRTAVAELLLLGMNADAIAGELGISYSTARNHIIAVYRHFEVEGQPEVMALLLLPLAFEFIQREKREELS